jgi:alpha-galactosidase
MTYEKEDQQPSIFVLKESGRQAMVAIFNWTEGQANGTYDVTEVLASTPTTSQTRGTLHAEQPAHSVRLLKLVDTSMSTQNPVAKITSVQSGIAGADLNFEAAEGTTENPILRYH